MMTDNDHLIQQRAHEDRVVSEYRQRFERDDLTIRSESGDAAFYVTHTLSQDYVHVIRVMSHTDTEMKEIVDRFVSAPAAITLRMEADEEWMLPDLLFHIQDGRRLLDDLEATVNEKLRRHTQFARLVDIHFSRLRDAPL